jgi:predicted histidine transporter YuiF (NhaC family)
MCLYTVCVMVSIIASCKVAGYELVESREAVFGGGIGGNMVYSIISYILLTAFGVLSDFERKRNRK